MSAVPTPRSHTDTSVGLVVCTYTADRLSMLVSCVASVNAQSRLPDELLVVVDGTEALATEVRAAVPGVRVECLGSNRGVAVARTRGAELVDCEWVVFLDDDAEADPQWLARLVAALDGPGVLGASGRSLASFDGPRPGWLPEEFLWTVGCSYRGMPERPALVRNFYGGCAIVARETFLSLGGFDPATGHHGDSVGGGEEADFCLRATAATGGVFAFDPAATITHRVPTARLTWAYYLRRCYSEGMMKARIASRLPQGALGPEQAFARALPGAVVRSAVRPAEMLRALGIVLGSLAVVAGLSAGRLAAVRKRRTP